MKIKVKVNGVEVEVEVPDREKTAGEKYDEMWEEWHKQQQNRNRTFTQILGVWTNKGFIDD